MRPIIDKILEHAAFALLRDVKHFFIEPNRILEKTDRNSVWMRLAYLHTILIFFSALLFYSPFLQTPISQSYYTDELTRQGFLAINNAREIYRHPWFPKIIFVAVYFRLAISAAVCTLSLYALVRFSKRQADIKQIISFILVGLCTAILTVTSLCLILFVSHFIVRNSITNVDLSRFGKFIEFLDFSLGISVIVMLVYCISFILISKNMKGFAFTALSTISVIIVFLSLDHQIAIYTEKYVFSHLKNYLERQETQNARMVVEQAWENDLQVNVSSSNIWVVSGNIIDGTVKVGQLRSPLYQHYLSHIEPSAELEDTTGFFGKKYGKYGVLLFSRDGNYHYLPLSKGKLDFFSEKFDFRLHVDKDDDDVNVRSLYLEFDQSFGGNFNNVIQNERGDHHFLFGTQESNLIIALRSSLIRTGGGEGNFIRLSSEPDLVHISNGSAIVSGMHDGDILNVKGGKTLVMPRVSNKQPPIITFDARYFDEFEAMLQSIQIDYSEYFSDLNAYVPFIDEPKIACELKSESGVIGIIIKLPDGRKSIALILRQEIGRMEFSKENQDNITAILCPSSIDIKKFALIARNIVNYTNGKEK